MVLLMVVMMMMMMMMMMIIIIKLYSNNNFNGKYLAIVSPKTVQTVWITKGLL
jgi:hypothetical protein